MDNIKKFIEFLDNMELLKKTTRTNWMTNGRRETVAEHSWRMSMLAFALQEEFPNLDINRVIGMCLVHDIDEGIDGDISAPMQTDQEAKQDKEEQDLKTLIKPLDSETQKRILSLWKEFHETKTEEAKLARAIDTLETINQQAIGKIPKEENFDYSFNLTWGKKYTDYNDFLKKFRKLVDEQTKKKI